VANAPQYSGFADNFHVPNYNGVRERRMGTPQKLFASVQCAIPRAIHI